MKAILILILYVQGAAEGQFTPAPAFDTMGECVAFYEENTAEILVEGGNVRALCVTETEVKELN